MNYYSNVKHHTCYCPFCLVERFSLGLAKVLLFSLVFLLLLIDDEFGSRVTEKKLSEQEKKEETKDE